MKRRNFITTAIGSMCIMRASAFPLSTFDSHQEIWFNNFIDKLNAKKKNRSSLNDQSLLDSYNNALQNWSKLGYKPLNDKFYVFEAQNLLLFPIVLNPHADILDICALCFLKNSHNQWQVQSKINGFHFESYHYFLQDFATKLSTEQLSQALLPTLNSSPQLSLNGYLTTEGEIDMKILTEGVSSKINIGIKFQNEVIWQKKYVSMNLRTNSLFV